MKTIKERNRRLIATYIIINCLIFFAVHNLYPKEISNYIIEWGKIVGFIVAANLFVSILNGFLSLKIKEVIVFWKLTNRLPGHYSFSKYAVKDPRISIQHLQDKLGVLPNEPKKQNELWYRIYLQHKDDRPILEIHRLYVLSRDLAGIIIIILFTYSLISLILKVDHYQFSFILFTIYLVQYFVLIIVSRNYCRQFVADVLARI